MALVNYLAEVWGISIVLISLALIIRPEYLKSLFAEVEKDATMFFLGITGVVVGISMVLSYNVWAQGWQVIITILGWIALVKGLSVLFLPQFIKNLVKKLETSSFLSYALLIFIFLGLALTYFGFTK